MEHYQEFIDLADEIIADAQNQYHRHSSDFQRNYFESLIRDVKQVKRTIVIHRDIMNPPAPRLSDDW